MAEQIIPNASVLTGWRKSSYSNNDSASCVEVVDGHSAGVPIRDSKDPDGPALVFAATAWTAFVEAVKRGDFAV
ncbi:DUF397 domain-containing protein [Actinacidiphila acidipaludis]|uniref:DUF397 domain-containing protein n=1 Tax=Actinacidiphila acidipaludis TaxID=2873382 RepID=A0ABS7Q739_9ACTN|nr:DUF397 domain-containing protein [Streptomyces acidipaludis]MBY8878946.1 DUF397 domain-containing protein [Streptomyces acidipaludis]